MDDQRAVAFFQWMMEDGQSETHIPHRSPVTSSSPTKEQERPITATPQFAVVMMRNENKKKKNIALLDENKRCHHNTLLWVAGGKKDDDMANKLVLLVVVRRSSSYGSTKPCHHRLQ